MAIQIHQLNEISSPAMTDYLADDTGSDTGKLSIETLAGAILADYQATFDQDTTDVVSKVTDIATAQTADEADIATLQTDVSGKVDKTGDTMTGSLTVTGDSQQRYFRINNGVRNVRLTVNADGNCGLYDDTNSKWVLYDQPGTDYLVINEGVRATSFTSTTNPTVIGATPSPISAVATGSWVDVASVTLPYAGTYIITGSLLISGTTGSVCGARLDSSSGNCRQSYTIPNTNIHGVSVSDIMYGSANQTVTIQVYCTGTINIQSGGRLKAVRIM